VSTTIELATDRDITHARQAGRTLAREQGLSAIDQARLATAASELARLFFVHSATLAFVSFRALIDGERCGIEICLQGSGAILDALLYRSRRQYQVLEHTQEGATIVIQQFWRP
jgi:anti-sigma regulatory factor (Ser/Thr protein kinase)